MQLLGFVSLLVFVATALAAEAPTELVIDTTYLPDNCHVKAKTGDSIRVHYVRLYLTTAVYFF